MACLAVIVSGVGQIPGKGRRLKKEECPSDWNEQISSEQYQAVRSILCSNEGKLHEKLDGALF